MNISTSFLLNKYGDILKTDMKDTLSASVF